MSRLGANDRLDHSPRAPLRSGRKGGIHKNALGRSRGGFSTKIHLRTNAHGLPIVTAFTPGEVHDMKGYKALMDEDAPPPKVMLADRGYDADAIRVDLSERGATPISPTKKNRRVQIEIDRAVYALRNRIERCFNRLKNARRFATRYDKLNKSICKETDVDTPETGDIEYFQNGKYHCGANSSEFFTGARLCDQLRQHLGDFMAAFNFARRLKTLRGLTPYEAI